MKDIREVLAPLCRLAVLVSGGIDSEVLLHAAVSSLGAGSVLALTAYTCFLAEGYRLRIPEVCRKLGVRHVPVKWDPLQVDEVAANAPDRCYHCKRAVYSLLASEAYRRGFPLAADGTSMDDLEEDRPGLRAAEEQNIIHPLVAAGMGKAEVRELGRQLGVDHPDRPHDSCLATRIPAGTALTAEKLRLVEKLEAPLIHVVTGRFRARLTPEAVVLDYTPADSELLQRHLEGIRETAAEAGLELSLNLLEVRD
jgi:uncharacterized protein